MDKGRYLVGVRLDDREIIAQFPTVKKAKTYIKQINKDFRNAKIFWSGFEMVPAKKRLNCDHQTKS